MVPNELLIRILSFLRISFIQLVCKRVSRKWNICASAATKDSLPGSLWVDVLWFDKAEKLDANRKEWVATYTCFNVHFDSQATEVIVTFVPTSKETFRVPTLRSHGLRHNFWYEMEALTRATKYLLPHEYREDLHFAHLEDEKSVALEISSAALGSQRTREPSSNWTVQANVINDDGSNVISIESLSLPYLDLIKLPLAFDVTSLTERTPFELTAVPNARQWNVECRWCFQNRAFECIARMCRTCCAKRSANAETCRRHLVDGAAAPKGLLK